MAILSPEQKQEYYDRLPHVEVDMAGLLQDVRHDVLSAEARGGGQQ